MVTSVPDPFFHNFCMCIVYLWIHADEETPVLKMSQVCRGDQICCLFGLDALIVLSEFYSHTFNTDAALVW